MIVMTLDKGLVCVFHIMQILLPGSYELLYINMLLNLVLKTMLLHGKVVDTSPELNMLSNVPQQNALYVMNNMCHSTRMPFEGLVLF